ncbi:MAG: TonB-dependent receptor [Pseudomonadota bacterium]
MLTAVAVAAVLAGNFAKAQESTEVDEIVVTARGLEENIQDVPLAITAFNEEALERRGIAELEDVARFTAGFAFEDVEGGAANPSIRGQSTLRGTTAREQTVATFVDGVYMPRNWLVDIGTSNLQRIEIVKGPQSARFGRNAFAGAINYVTKKADLEEFAADVTLTAGSDELLEYGIAVNVPIVEDKVALRVAYEDSEFDGTWENTHPNANLGLSPGTEGNVGGRDSDNISVNLLFDVNESLTLDLSYLGSDRSEEARAFQGLITATGDGNCGALQPIAGGGTGGSLFCGEFSSRGDTVSIDPRGFGRQGSADIYRLTASYDVNDSWNISYTFGSIEADNLAAASIEQDTINCAGIISFLGTCNFQGSPAGEVDYHQSELKATFRGDGPLSYAIGVFFMEGEDSRQSYSFNQAPLSSTPLGIDNLSNGLPFPASVTALRFGNELTDTTTTAIFGELTYHVSDMTRVLFEVRYTDEDIRTFAVDDGVLTGELSDSFITPRLTIERDLNADQLIYGTVARGAKAGGFNAGAVSPELTVFDPEFNWTYEIGSKNVLADGRLVLNGALFLTQWSDQQINSADPLGGPFTPVLTRNLGDATIYGLEIEGNYQVTDAFSLDMAISYTDATYDSGTIDELYTRGTAAFPPPCDDIVCSSNGDIGGNDLQNSPPFQFALGGQYEGEINGFDFYVRGDVGHQSSYFASQINAAEFEGRTIFNASAGVTIDRFDIRLWARNLTDEEYVSNGSQIVQQFSNNILTSYLGERRVVGATVTVDF